MRLTSRHELAFVTATLTHRGTSIEIADVLVDTGAVSTVIDADHAARAGIYLEPTDRLRRLRSVGGHEHVFVRKVDRFAVDGRGLDGFEIEMGELDYGLSVRRHPRNGLPARSGGDPGPRRADDRVRCASGTSLNPGYVSMSMLVEV